MVNRAGQARSGSSFFTGPPTESGVKLINVVILGVAFMLIFTAFQTMGIIEQTIIHSIRQDNPRFTGDGYTSLAILYVVFALSNWLAPAVVYSIGGKYSMMIGAVTYAFFIGSFIKPMEWTLYLSSGLLGLGAAMLWCGQGMFLTKNSDQDTMGRNSGIFWALLQCSLLFGNLYVFYEFAGHSYISQEKRSHLVWVFLALTLIGFGLLCVLRRQVADENVDQEPGVVFEPVTQLYRSYNLLMTKEMVLLTFTFLYTGLELSFFSGVYGSCIGFTEDYGDRRKQLVGLSGIFIGLGEILGGALFGILGMRTAVYGRDPIVLLGMLTHVTTFFIIFLILPFDAPFGETESIAFLQPSATLVIVAAFGLGFGDSCYNTQLYSLVGRYFVTEAPSAFAIFKFMQSIAAATAFAYSNYLDLRVQLGILVVFCIFGSYTFWSVEWSTHSAPEAEEEEAFAEEEEGEQEEEQEPQH